MKMSKKILFSISLVLMIGLFTSCSENTGLGEMSNSQNENSALPENRNDDILEYADCFELVYPVTIVFPDSSEVLVNDLKSLETEVTSWYELNSEIEEDVSLLFPVGAILADGTEQVLEDDDALEDLIDSCEDEEEGEHDDEEDEEDEEDEDEDDDEDDEDEDDNEFDDFNEDCFNVDFPLSFTLPDGTEYTVGNNDEATEIIQSYYELNPNESDEPELVFPVNIVYEDGSVSMINTEEEFENAEDDCE